MFNLAGAFAHDRMFECDTIKPQDAGAWILKVLVASIYPHHISIRCILTEYKIGIQIG